jgi:hypothetical protein
MRILLIISLSLFTSCDEKEIDVKKSTQTSTPIVIDTVDYKPKSFIIHCDTIPAVFINTETGSITINDEVICDTILN